MPRVRIQRVALFAITALSMYTIGTFVSLSYVHHDNWRKPLPQHDQTHQKPDYNAEHKPLKHRGHLNELAGNVDHKEPPHFLNDTAKIDDEQWMNAMDNKMRQRKKLLLDVCQNRYNRRLTENKQLADTPKQLRALVVNDQNRFLYSIAYKVGSTNWERVIVEMAGYKNVPNQKLYSHSALKWMPKFTPGQIAERLDKYTKFLFVRNPFSRILSAYKDKFVDHHFESFNRIGRTIIKKHRKSKFNELEVNGTDVSFQEFVDYLIDGHHTSNVHWTPIHSQNYPCEIDFDYIGKLEESNDDVKYVLKKIGIWGQAYYHKGRSDPTGEQRRLRTYYSTLTPESMEKIYKIYEPDFVMFGYDVPDTT